MVIPIVVDTLDTITKRLLKRLEDLEITGQLDHPNYSIIEIGQNTEKSPGDLRRLAGAQTLVRKPLVSTGVKNSKRSNNNKTMELESDGDTDFAWCIWENPQRIGTGTLRLGNKRTSRDH